MPAEKRAMKIRLRNAIPRRFVECRRSRSRVYECAYPLQKNISSHRQNIRHRAEIIEGKENDNEVVRTRMHRHCLALGWK